MLSCVDKGKGRAIVFVHAFPLNNSMWESQIKYFGKRYRVVAPDVQGFGGSIPARPWDMEKAGEDLRTLMDALAIDACTLVGLSMGGYIALPFAAKYPDRIEKLVLAHTRARADNETEKANRSEMVAALQEGGIEILPDRMAARLLGPNPSAALRDRVKEMILTASPSAAIFAVTAMRGRADATPL